jgi:hypothetical protein
VNTCPLTDPTFQQVFDFGLAKIIQQGEASVTASQKACAYRTDGGLKCVVGHMLGGDVDLTNLNSVAVDQLIRSRLPSAYDWMKNEQMLTLLRRMQRAHDQAFSSSDEGEGDFVSQFKIQMELVASISSLEYKEPA